MSPRSSLETSARAHPLLVRGQVVLGYRAALLEGGFGFAQFFLHPYRRCAQDRLAETIVVTERSYQQKFPAQLGTPPEADTASAVN